MNTVCKQDMCAGCGACAELCPKAAIRIERGFKAYNARIDGARCVDCGACRRICPQNNRPELRKPMVWKEGWARDLQLRAGSASGGLAAAIERAFVEGGGVVCSCAFSDGAFRFHFAERRGELAAFAGSCYVKSDPAGIYRRARALLKAGRKLLLVGLPCQSAAVQNAVGDASGLYTVDLICHGTPAPETLEYFCRDAGVGLDELRSLRFRGEDGYGLRYARRDDAELRRFTVPGVRDFYTAAFLGSMINTENCYACPYAGAGRPSDLTLGDSWGSDLPEDEKKRGISLALAQTQKGKELLEWADACLRDADARAAVEANLPLRRPSARPPQRERVLDMMQSGVGISRIVRRCLPKRYWKDQIKRLLYRFRG